MDPPWAAWDACVPIFLLLPLAFAGGSDRPTHELDVVGVVGEQGEQRDGRSVLIEGLCGAILGEYQAASSD